MHKNNPTLGLQGRVFLCENAENWEETCNSKKDSLQ